MADDRSEVIEAKEHAEWLAERDEQPPPQTYNDRCEAAIDNLRAQLRPASTKINIQPAIEEAATVLNDSLRLVDHMSVLIDEIMVMVTEDPLWHLSPGTRARIEGRLQDVHLTLRSGTPRSSPTAALPLGGRPAPENICRRELGCGTMRLARQLAAGDPYVTQHPAELRLVDDSGATLCSHPLPPPGTLIVHNKGPVKISSGLGGSEAVHMSSKGGVVLITGHPHELVDMGNGTYGIGRPLAAQADSGDVARTAREELATSMTYTRPDDVNRVCPLDTDGDGNCPVHPGGC